MQLRRPAVIRIGVSVVLCAALIVAITRVYPNSSDSNAATTTRTLGDGTISLVQAVPADSFVESLGIDMHYMWSPRPQAEVEAAFTDLGIRYTRDDLTVPYDTYLAQGSHWIDRLQSLKRLGVSTLVIPNILATPPSEVMKYLHAANDTQPGTIYAIDGPNEVDYECSPNGTQFTGTIWVECPTNLWVPPTESFMQSMRSALDGDSLTHGMTIYSPSIASVHFNVKTTIPSYSNYANLHYYPLYSTGYSTYSMASERAGAAQFYGPQKPVVITEVGYTSESLDQNRPSNETSQAKVLPTYYLEAFHEGVVRTFIYQLMDASAHGDNWGLIDVNGNKKQAYYSIRTLTSALRDPGATFAPGSLRYQVTGTGSAHVASQLFQKRDGTYYIALWQPDDSSSPAPLANDESSRLRNITVSFGSSISTVNLTNLVDPSGIQSGGNSPTKSTTYTNPTSITNITIGDAPMLLKVTVANEPTPSPTGSTPTPTPRRTPKSTFKPPTKQSHPTQPTPTPSTGTTPPPDTTPPVPDSVPGFYQLMDSLGRFFYRMFQGLNHFL